MPAAMSAIEQPAARLVRVPVIDESDSLWIGVVSLLVAVGPGRSGSSP
jgi:hypothetical protein